MKNVKSIDVKFGKLYNNPTFNNLFSRWKRELIENVWINMRVNHTHYADIKRMASAFGYEVKENK
jgi:hypothetical protein